MEILRALSVGGTLEEIAASQYVSRNTVKTHVRLIYKKLHVNTRAAAALVMKRFGEQLVESPQENDGNPARGAVDYRAASEYLPSTQPVTLQPPVAAVTSRLVTPAV
jgi:DNA-binding CsgD family transcriptional regulator